MKNRLNYQQMTGQLSREINARYIIFPYVSSASDNNSFRTYHFRFITSSWFDDILPMSCNIEIQCLTSRNGFSVSLIASRANQLTSAHIKSVVIASA